ncbi:MAG: glycosyltransferase [Bacteroidota bacterium]
MEQQHKVSICMITYNHEKYIREAIEGVLMQECDFEIELIIANDCSTDKTDDVIQNIVENHPKASWVKYIKQKENLGMMPNFIFAMQQCKGEYIALCEGDDYWTDPLKLQKQVDFLDANTDYVLCFHQVNVLKNNCEIVDDFITKVPENYETIETLARLGNYIQTPSVVFRNIIKEFPFEFSYSPIGDYFLYMMLAEYGKLKYLEDKMCVYREGVGVWSDKSIYFRNFNTALVHAYLVEYFSGKESQRISGILHERIRSFINNFESQISKEDMINLSSNVLIRTSIFDLLLTNLVQLKNGSIDKKKTRELIQIIFRRVKKGIWKKLGL